MTIRRLYPLQSIELKNKYTMSFEYIPDLYGKLRRGKYTRFTELEQTAKLLMRQFVNGNLNNKDFAIEFKKVGDTYHKLTTESNVSRIDEDTPLWLNSLLGFHFIDWYRFQRIEQYFNEHPEELYGERLSNYKELKKQNYTAKLKYVCSITLSELEKL